MRVLRRFCTVSMDMISVMPELPEVEVTRLSFAQAIAGATVAAVRMGKPLRTPEAALHEQAYRAAGIPILEERLATSAAEAAACAALGEKLVLKIVSPEITHKTEVGGVMLNVAAADAAFRQADAHGVGRKCRIVLGASEALLLRRGDDLAVAHQGGRAVVIIGGDAQNVHQNCCFIEPGAGPGGSRTIQ